MSEKMDVFNTLNGINVNEHTEKKGQLTYLSWAWAWAEVKKRYPDAQYTIYENRDGWFYHTDGKTCWVKTGVTINGLEHIEYLPVMDFKNNSVPLEKVTSVDVNKSIQRSLTKAVARHGLGLYVYAGEDLPEDGAKKDTTVTRIISDKERDEFMGAIMSAFPDNESRNNAYKRIMDEVGAGSTKVMTEEQFKKAMALVQKYGQRG